MPNGCAAWRAQAVRASRGRRAERLSSLVDGVRG